MSGYYKDKDRKIIPRWRNFHVTALMKELESLGTPPEVGSLSQEFFDEKIRDWKENRTFSFAAEVVSSAVVLGRESEARDAAQFLIDGGCTGFDAAKSLAQIVLGIRKADDVHNLGMDGIEVAALRQKIHTFRSSLHDEPRNVFLWADLSLAYEILSFPEQAEKAICIAMTLAPQNRFILRSAARLFIHQDRFRDAHNILRRSTRVKHDPWLLSAEIAVASTAGRSSQFVKTARNMLVSERYPPFHLSELASALGTLDLEAGKSKWARRQLERSLADPTENSIAQASWLARHISGIQLAQDLDKLGPTSQEALAWSYYSKQDWELTVNKAQNWLFDQPFSSRPAIFGSYIAAMAMGNFGTSAEIASMGLVANPHNFTLLNNYSFAAAQTGHIDQAKQAFSRINVAELSDEETIVWLATSGLLRYRSGYPEEGRRLYLDAIERAKTKADSKRHALALLCFATEEVRAGTSEAESYKREALEVAGKISAPEVQSLKARLRELKKALCK